MRHGRLIPLGGLLISTILLGCQGDPHFHRYTRTKPDVEEIVGIWTLDSASRKLVREAGYPAATATVEFKADRTVVSGIPDWWDFDNRRVKGGLDSASGTWTIKQNQDDWVLDLDFPAFHGRKPGQSRWLHLGNQKPPYQIIATVGDPDAGRAMIFEKGAIGAGSVAGESRPINRRGGA